MAKPDSGGSDANTLLLVDMTNQVCAALATALSMGYQGSNLIWSCCLAMVQALGCFGKTIFLFPCKTLITVTKRPSETIHIATLL